MKTNHLKPPILLLQWLDEHEMKEAARPFRSFRKEVRIRYVESTDAAKTLDAIRTWLHDNPNAQFLYIGSHGSPEALGAKPQECIRWSELGLSLRRAKKPVVLRLGACDSRFAAEQWKRKKKNSALYVVGFGGKVRPSQLTRALSRMTRTNRVTGVEEELPQLRRILPRVRITMHYPVREKGYRTYR